MKKIRFFLVPLLALLIASCDNGIDSIIEEVKEPAKEEPVPEDGIFVGLASNSYPMAYDVSGKKANPLGSSIKLQNLIVIDDNNFTAVPEDKEVAPFSCKKVLISKSEYEPANDQQNKCFGGLWFYLNKNKFENSLVMAIKPVDDHWEVAIANLQGGYTKVTAQLETATGHQELIFEISSEITGRENSIWVLTASSLAGYDFKSDILNLTSRGDSFGDDFFKFQAIHNVLL